MAQCVTLNKPFTEEGNAHDCSYLPLVALRLESGLETIHFLLEETPGAMEVEM